MGDTDPSLVLDVLLYGSVPVGKKPAGIPDSWPAQVIERKTAKDPLTPGYVRMTGAQYDAYRGLHQAEYDAWEQGVPDPADETQTKQDRATLDALRAKPREKWTPEDVTAAVQAMLIQQTF